MALNFKIYIYRQVYGLCELGGPSIPAGHREGPYSPGAYRKLPIPHREHRSPLLQAGHTWDLIFFNNGQPHVAMTWLHISHCSHRLERPEPPFPKSNEQSVSSPPGYMHKRRSCQTLLCLRNELHSAVTECSFNYNPSTLAKTNKNTCISYALALAISSTPSPPTYSAPIV